MLNDQFVVERVLEKMDKLDEKFDTKIDKVYTDVGECKDNINGCKLDIQSVQKDLTNHLDNKKSETESFKRRTKFAMAIIGIAFTAYATIKELL